MNYIKPAVSILLLSLFVFNSACKREVRDQDGNLCETVKLGKQEWMKMNLNVSHFRNGDPIPEAKSNKEWIIMGIQGKPAWCIQDNNPENESTYGKLYNWYAVNDPRGLAPNGFHIPTDDEWTQLINYLGGNVLAALKMRTNPTGETVQSVKEVGFAGLAGGYRTDGGKFEGEGSYAYWWSSTELNKEAAWIRLLNYLYCNVYFSAYSKANGFSVRCVKD